MSEELSFIPATELTPMIREKTVSPVEVMRATIAEGRVYAVGGKPIPLEPGMYFSVEPGLYFDPKDETVPAGFRGVGIRVEDDVLVNPKGPDVITGGIAKEVSDMENRF